MWVCSSHPSFLWCACMAFIPQWIPHANWLPRGPIPPICQTRSVSESTKQERSHECRALAITCSLPNSSYTGTTLCLCVCVPTTSIIFSSSLPGKLLLILQDPVQMSPLPGALPAPVVYHHFHFSLCTLSSNMPKPFSRYLLGPYYFYCLYTAPFTWNIHPLMLLLHKHLHIVKTTIAPSSILSTSFRHR